MFLEVSCCGLKILIYHIHYVEICAINQKIRKYHTVTVSEPLYFML